MLQIDNKFKVTVDKYNFILTEKKKTIAKRDSTHRKEGEQYEIEEEHGYFSDISACLRQYLNLMITRKVENESVSIKELLDYIKHVKDEILQLKELKPKRQRK